MNVLITGATGFLGSKIASQIKATNVIRLSRSGADINVDLSTEIPLLSPTDLVVHCAGKAHSVPKTQNEKDDFFQTNVTGTENLLKGMEQLLIKPKAIIFISSVSVYGVHSGILIDEATPLNAVDPYGLSKIRAELMVSKWCSKHNVNCTILRLPLLVGNNPPGNLATMIEGIKKGYYFNIAGGNARKSMVLIEDIAAIILKVSIIGGTYNLTDGIHPSFYELSNLYALQLKKKPPYNIPFWLAKTMAIIGDLLGGKAPINTNKLNKMVSDLTFDDSKARSIIGWQPKPVLENLLK